ncbi:mu-type opioid receptor-like [Rhopilema esculentum]|uniref:mu-type opioid receptor-like n=1 Tax=Rhopilema esculentum TaxID=499914 RepID=UPI0031D39937
MICADLFRSKNRSFEYGTFSYGSSAVNEDGELKTIIFTVLIATMMVFGMLTNGFVIYVLGCKNRAKKSDVFIIALALLDIMTFFAGSTENFKDIHRLPIPPYLNHIINIVFIGAMQGSGWIMFCITIERYWAIKKPLQFRRITLKTRVFAALASILFTTTFTVARTIYIEDDFVLYMYITNSMQYLSFILPLISITCLYATCIRQLKQNHPKISNNIAQERRLASHKRICQHFLVVISLYFICVAPVTIFTTTLTVRVSRDPKMVCSFITSAKNPYHFLISLFYINGCINPFLYARIHPQIKRSVEVFKCWQDTNVRATNNAEGTAIELETRKMYSNQLKSLKAVEIEE